MKNVFKSGCLLLCLCMILAAFPIQGSADDMDNIIGHNHFLENADYTEVFYRDAETGFPMTAFMDRQGNYACCTYQEDTYQKIGAAGPYAAFLREVPKGEYFAADLSQNRIIFSSAATPCDELLAIACWKDHCYLAAYKKNAGFDAVTNVYTIYDEEGRAVQQKTFSAQMKKTEYLGEV